MTAPTSLATKIVTTRGVLRGERDGGLSVFRGVRYAEPPVGPLRLAAPRRTLAWEGVRPATAFGPPPPQAGQEAMAGGDDWLTLNVWTPAPEASAGLPVLVWIPGGGYVVGHAGLPEYDGARLGATGTVVVTLTYRLGVEGFAHVGGAPANRGLLDQVTALEWVRDEIAAFGGDPGNVTIGGQSAGAGSVAALMAMPRAAGLFRRAIAQSVPGTFFSAALASDVAAACAAELGVAPTRDGLSSVEPALLAAAGDMVAESMAGRRSAWGAITHRPIPFAPVVDGEVLPVTPWEALAAGAGRDVPLVVGHTRDEHRLFDLIDGLLGQVTPGHAATALDMLAPGPGGGARYREAFPGASDPELYDLVNGDWLFRMPSLHLADAQAAGGGQVHLFELTWPAPGLGGVLGACHGLDVPLVFGTLAQGNPAALIGDPVPAAAEALSGEFRRAWAAFAATGDPGWPAYDPDLRLTRLFDDPVTVTAYPEEASRRLWQDHAFAALPLRER